MIQRLLTAAEFSHERIEFPDAGQWAELVRGVPMMLEPPDSEHGTVVLNLSKALAAYVHESLNGYPCFDLGLLLETAPDTVLYPAISYFFTGERFAEADKEYTDTVPGLVTELLTSRARKHNLEQRIGFYLARGVQTIWLIDPQQRAVFVVDRTAARQRLTEFEHLNGEPLLAGFQIKVADLFTPPDWEFPKR